MRIEIETSEITTDEATALIALFASLGGRLPEPAVAYIPGPPEGQPVPTTPREAADALMSLAAQTRKAPPPPPEASEETEDAETPGGDPLELDPDGIPWDGRIHAASKGKNGDGRWKRKAKIEDAFYESVKAELKAAHAGNAPPPPPTEEQAPPPPAPDADTPATDSAPTAEASEPAGAATAANGSRFESFASFVQAVNNIRTPPIPYLELNTFAQTVGAPAFKDMKDFPNLWEDFYALAGGV